MKSVWIALLSLCLASPGQAEIVKIGCLFPLTGPGGLYGRDSAVAARMAVDHVATSEQPGYPALHLQVADTRSKSLRSVQITKDFVEQDVDFLCGVVSSSIARAVSAEARRAQVFFIGTDHASPALVTDDLHPYYFRVSNGTRQSMLAGARYIAENYATDAPLRIAFVGPDYDYGYQAWDDLRQFLKKQNVRYEIAVELWPKLFETDYTLYVRELIKARPDIVVSGHWGLDLVTFIKQSVPLGLFETAQFMNFDAGGNYEVFAELGNDMPMGLVLSARHHVNWPPTARNTYFVSEFYERSGRYPSYAAQGAYSGILAIAEAVRTAGGSKDKDALREALKHLVLSLPEDPEGFQSRMDPNSHQLMQVQAIGKTVFDNRFPPATVQLGNWSVYLPPERLPVSHEKISD